MLSSQRLSIMAISVQTEGNPITYDIEQLPPKLGERPNHYIPMWAISHASVRND